MNSARQNGGRVSLALPLQMFGGLVIGLLLALLWPSFAQALQPLGRVVGISFAWFYFATFCATLVALGLNGLFHPGVSVGLVPTGKVPPNLAVSIGWVKFFLDLIPSNIVAVMTSGKLLPTLVFSVLFGVALAGIGEQAQPIVGLLEAIIRGSRRARTPESRCARERQEASVIERASDRDHHQKPAQPVAGVFNLDLAYETNGHLVDVIWDEEYQVQVIHDTRRMGGVSPVGAFHNAERLGGAIGRDF